MTFASPLWLWGLLALPVLVVVARRLGARRARYAIRFPNLRVLAGSLPAHARRRRLVPAALWFGALAVLLLGLARPHADVSVPREEATVVLVMDVSGSMEAEDVEPSRLVAAQRAARLFLGQLPPRFQVGVVAFSDRVDVLAQPTVDRTAVRDGLDALIPGGGTAMGEALGQALELGSQGRGPAAARRDRQPLDAVLLLSDGYNTAGRLQPLEAAARAQRLGIPTFTIALGTPEGVVRGSDQFGRPRVVPVPPDPDTLREIAESTGGSFFTAPTEEELAEVYSDLGTRIGHVTEPREVTAAFAAGAVVLAGLGAALSLLWTGRLP